MRKRKSFGFICLMVASLILPSIVHSQVKINEFVPDAKQEWVEFYNASNSAEYLKDYWIDDDTDFRNEQGSAKKLLSTLNTTSVGFPYFELSSFFNNSGDYVVLFDGLGNIIDQYQYTEAAPKELSYGRNPDGSGNFNILEKTTKGSSNALPRPSSTPTSEPQEQAPTAAPTPIVTSTPTGTPVKTTPPTKKPTPRISPSPSPEEMFSAGTPQVLSLITSEEELTSPTPLIEGETVKKINPLSVALLIVGFVIILIAFGLFVKSRNSQIKKPFDEITQ